MTISAAQQEGRQYKNLPPVEVVGLGSSKAGVTAGSKCDRGLSHEQNIHQKLRGLQLRYFPQKSRRDAKISKAKHWSQQLHQVGQLR